MFDNELDNSAEGDPVSDFISVIIHQLKAPLTNNKWALDVVRKGGIKNLSEEQMEMLNEIYQNNDYAISLVENLLSAYKEGSSALELKLEEIDLKKQIEGVIEKSKLDALNKNISIKFSVLENASDKITGDKEKLRYVLENIISNAIRYTKNNGSVNIELSEEDNNAVISIADTGIGIPEREQEKILNKFYRASNAHNAEKGGAGLGLFISKGIVLKHGGRIFFERNKETGTVFYIYLPKKIL